jgi:hypothetical protein
MVIMRDIGSSLFAGGGRILAERAGRGEAETAAPRGHLIEMSRAGREVVTIRLALDARRMRARRARRHSAEISTSNPIVEQA